MANQKSTMGTIKTKSNIKYQISKMFILHGWTYSTQNWKPFLKALADAGLKPQLLKIPGLTEKIDRPWNLDGYVEWLNEKIGTHKAVLIGHSSGGRIALTYTLKYPQKVEHLILIDSAGVYHKELPIRIKRFIFRKIAKWGKRLSTYEGLRSLLYKLTGESDYRKASPLMRQTMQKLISYDLTPKLPQIKIPTLIIWGELDKTTPVDDGRLMHKLIPSSRLHIIRSAKHSPQFTNPKEVVRITKKFIMRDSS